MEIYDHNLVDKSAEKIKNSKEQVPLLAGPIPLPTQQTYL